MAITESHSGTETVTTTEWSLTSDSSTLGAVTDDGIYQLLLDISAVTAADLFELAVYEKVLSAGTQRKAWTARLTVETTPHMVFPTLVLLHGWEMTLKKISGTDRSISWSIRKVA